jgi:glycerol-3-phosphate O-acyltransferase
MFMNNANSTEKEDPEYNRIADQVRKFLKKTFNHVYIDGPQLDEQKMRAMSVMPVCTHRSQTDYFIFGQFLHDMGFRRIRYAAGDNLTKLPWLGPKFLRWGAFPVSRSRAMNRTYLRKLCEQVTGMMQEGSNVVVFPESGRSYKGQMMEIRGGMLGACLVAQWRNPDKQFYFFPSAISYERLPELLYFDMLQKGRDIRSENGNILNRIRGNFYYFGADIIAFSKLFISKNMNRTCGDIYIDYEKPVAVNDIIDLKAHFSAKSRDEFSSLRTAIQYAGEYLHSRFLSLYRLLPSHVLSRIIINKNSISRQGAVQQVDKLVAALRKGNRNTKTLDSLSAEQIIDTGVSQLSAFKALSCKKGLILISKPSVIKYHAASIPDA